MHPVLISIGTLGETQQQYVFALGASSTVFDAGLHRIASEIPVGVQPSEHTQLVEQRVLELMWATEGKRDHLLWALDRIHVSHIFHCTPLIFLYIRGQC